MKKIAYFLVGMAMTAMTACGGSVKEATGTDSADLNQGIEQATIADTTVAPGYAVAETIRETYSIENPAGMNLPVIIDFNATWCGPCKMFAPVFEEVGEANKEKAHFISVDIDQDPATASLFEFSGIPCVAIVYPAAAGKAPVLHQGYMDKAEFEKFINENI